MDRYRPGLGRFRTLCSLFLLLACHAVWAASAMGVDDARHFLNRVGFGATPDDIASFARLSHQEAVRRVLTPLPSAPQVAPPAELIEYLPPSQMRTMREEDKQAFQRMRVKREAGMRAWWLGEMLTAETPGQQLRERMVLFWHNHFVSSSQKVKETALLLQQNQLFRDFALGSFADLLHAVGKDPAMVVYLDSASNRKGTPNENFAREVMELFTLGEGHYSEQDVKEAARAFTGWSIEPASGKFKWRPFAHDDGIKTVLGRSGNFDGDDVLDILLAQPQAAEFVVSKLWREFVSPTPDAQEVKRIARVFRDSHYETRTALAALLNSPAFWAPENRGVLIKSPVDLVVGTLHTFGVRAADPLPFTLALRQQGQDLFAPPNVKGWPGGETWVNSNTLLLRKQFLDRLLRSGQAMVESPLNVAMRDESMGKNELRRRMLFALSHIEVNVPIWQQQLAENGLSESEVLLAVPPSGAAVTTANGIEGVRRMVLSTEYQLR